MRLTGYFDRIWIYNRNLTCKIILDRDIYKTKENKYEKQNHSGGSPPHCVYRRI